MLERVRLLSHRGGRVAAMKTTDTDSKLLATLKRHAPARVLAYSGDDDAAREVAVPKTRKRWDRVMTALAGIPWSKVELLDTKGALLATFDNTAPAGDLEDLSTGRGEVTSRDVQLHRVLLDMMLRAQKEVLQYRDAEMTQLLQAQGTVTRELVAGFRELRTIYEAQVEAAANLAQIRAEAENGGSLKELLDAAPQLLQALPLIRGLLKGTTSTSAPTNGVKKE